MIERYPGVRVLRACRGRGEYHLRDMSVHHTSLGSLSVDMIKHRSRVSTNRAPPGAKDMWSLRTRRPTARCWTY